MLSTQILEPDPNEISQLNSKICIDERDSEVDLFKSRIDDKNPSTPNFSIRDYVFKTRGKALKTNWPFSLKKLHLLRKHGVTDVLPPFQPIENARKRNQSRTKFAVENTIDSDKISVLPIQTPSLKPESEQNSPRSPESPIGNTQNLVKKSKLIVKMKHISESRLNMSKCLETTMASKVCPVCKTFSSSSNTTLNAHIDQCLSGVSTSKSTTNSKAIKNVIKPRKTRSMVDIYATAKHCTLEDLDRRNGRNLVSNVGFSDQELTACNKEKKNEEGAAVYVDSSGKKICILSKLSNLPSKSSAKDDDCGTKKLAKSDKGSKFASIKKKRHIFKKHKVKKCAPYRQRSCSPQLDHYPEVNDVQERDFSREEFSEEDDIDVDQMRKNWVGSQRNGLKKKINLEHENQHPVETVKNLRAKNSLSSREDMFINKMHDSNSPNFSDENPLSPTKNRKRRVNSSCDSDDEFTEQPSPRNRSGLSSLDSRDFHGKRNKHLMPSKLNVKESRKDVPSVQKRNIDRIYCSENRVVSSPAKNSDRSRIRGVNEFATLPKLKVKLGRKRLDFKKRRYIPVLGEKAVVARSEIRTQNNTEEELRENATAEMERPIRIGSTNRREFVQSDVEEKSLSSKDIDSSTGGNVVSAGTSTVKETEIRDEFVSEPTEEEALIAFTSYPCDFVIPDTNEEQGTYFVDVDPILIPGPPGSFLPSPGRMSSEEIQGNSSLTTCRRQSSHEEQDDEFLDMAGSSHSHVSARSETESFLNLSEMNNFDGSRNGLMLPEMGQFKNRHQPCCCYWKDEGANLQSNYQNNQESQLVHGYQKSVANSLLVHAPVVASQNSGSMFPTFGHSESILSPSSLNPVLRLMGKNLTVMNNKDEIFSSPQTRPAQSNMVNIPNEHHSFHNAFSRPVYNQVQPNIPAQNVDFVSSNSFKIPGNIQPQEYDPMHMNYFACYQNGSRMVQNSNIQVSSSNVSSSNATNANSVQWNNCSVNSSTDSPSSTNHMRSSMYFSPGGFS